MLPSNISSKTTEGADVVVFTARYDATSSFVGGSAEGPNKVLECFEWQVEVFERRTKKPVSLLTKIAHHDFGELNTEKPEVVVNRIRDDYERVLPASALPILIGGEHTVTAGALAALAKRHNPKDVTILHIDAHMDMREDDSDYHEESSKFAHSTVMRRVHEMGYSLVQVGIRAFSEDEYNYSQKHKNITVFEWGSKIPSVDKVLSTIKTKKVYLSVDIDGIDPSHLPGTGTPVPGGLSWYYFQDLMDAAFTRKQVIGADVVEVIPQKDSVITEYGVAELVYRMCSHRLP